MTLLLLEITSFTTGSGAIAPLAIAIIIVSAPMVVSSSGRAYIRPSTLSKLRCLYAERHSHINHFRFLHRMEEIILFHSERTDRAESSDLLSDRLRT